jgi:hypothetical protein
VRTAAGTGTVDSTAHHLFWDLTTTAWTEADHLQAGDRLWTPDSQLATVARTVSVPDAEDMWDLTVANDHDFYVVTVDTAVLVHTTVQQPAGQPPPVRAPGRPGKVTVAGRLGDALKRGTLASIRRQAGLVRQQP